MPPGGRDPEVKAFALEARLNQSSRSWMLPDTLSYNRPVETLAPSPGGHSNERKAASNAGVFGHTLGDYRIQLPLNFSNRQSFALARHVGLGCEEQLAIGFGGAWERFGRAFPRRVAEQGREKGFGGYNHKGGEREVCEWLDC